MGFNVSGIAINKNFESDFEDLQKEFHWNLEFVEDINFETAFQNWKEEGICDVYFSNKGTLLFVSMDMCIEPWSISQGNTFTFALSETSMTFNFSFCKDHKMVRSVMEVDGDRINEEGDKLEVEGSAEDTSEIIWGQIGTALGKKIWDIEFTDKAKRYRFVKPESQSVTSNQEFQSGKIVKRENIVLEIKKWWQFWK